MEPNFNSFVPGLDLSTIQFLILIVSLVPRLLDCPLEIAVKVEQKKKKKKQTKEKTTTTTKRTMERPGNRVYLPGNETCRDNWMVGRPGNKARNGKFMLVPKKPVLVLVRAN